MQIPTSKLDFIIRSVAIASYIPGRIRLYSQKLVNNPALEKEIKGELSRFAEIITAETSVVTGSVLIKYNPAVLRQNAELKKVEQYIMTHVEKRA